MIQLLVTLVPEAGNWNSAATLSAGLLEMQCKSGVGFRVSKQTVKLAILKGGTVLTKVFQRLNQVTRGRRNRITAPYRTAEGVGGAHQ